MSAGTYVHEELAWAAGLFDGDVFVKGILHKYASLFSIDHPLDPDRRTLNHAAVEAPEYKTFYDGVAGEKNRRASDPSQRKVHVL